MLRHVSKAMGWPSAVLTLILIPLGTANAASAILIDDFNDGNDDGWLHLAPTTLAPGIFDATSGGYHIQSATATNTNGQNWLFSGWQASDGNPLYSNGLIRVKVRVDTRGNTAGPGIRVMDDDSGYWFVGDSYTRDFLIARNSPADGWREFHIPGVRFDVGEDWIIEGGIVGDELSMKVWRDGNTPPVTPQLVRNDERPLPAGVIGVVSFIDVRNPPVRIDATFDDISFTPIPEPSTAVIEVFGLLGLAASRRRKPSTD